MRAVICLGCVCSIVAVSNEGSVGSKWKWTPSLIKQLHSLGAGAPPLPNPECYGAPRNGRTGGDTPITHCQPLVVSCLNGYTASAKGLVTAHYNASGRCSSGEACVTFTGSCMPGPEIQEESSSSSDPVEGQFPGASIVVSDFSLRDAPERTEVFINGALRDFECNHPKSYSGTSFCQLHVDSADFPINYCVNGSSVGPKYRTLAMGFDGPVCNTARGNACGAKLVIPDPADITTGGLNIVAELNSTLTALARGLKFGDLGCDSNFFCKMFSSMCHNTCDPFVLSGRNLLNVTLLFKFDPAARTVTFLADLFEFSLTTPPGGHDLAIQGTPCDMSGARVLAWIEPAVKDMGISLNSYLEEAIVELVQSMGNQQLTEGIFQPFSDSLPSIFVGYRFRNLGFFVGNPANGTPSVMAGQIETGVYIADNLAVLNTSNTTYEADVNDAEISPDYSVSSWPINSHYFLEGIRTSSTLVQGLLWAGTFVGANHNADEVNASDATLNASLSWDMPLVAIRDNLNVNSTTITLPTGRCVITCMSTCSKCAPNNTVFDFNFSNVVADVTFHTTVIGQTLGVYLQIEAFDMTDALCALTKPPIFASAVAVSLLTSALEAARPHVNSLFSNTSVVPVPGVLGALLPKPTIQTVHQRGPFPNISNHGEIGFTSSCSCELHASLNDACRFACGTALDLDIASKAELRRQYEPEISEANYSSNPPTAFVRTAIEPTLSSVGSTNVTHYLYVYSSDTKDENGGCCVGSAGQRGQVYALADTNGACAVAVTNVTLPGVVKVKQNGELEELKLLCDLNCSACELILSPSTYAIGQCYSVDSTLGNSVMISTDPECLGGVGGVAPLPKSRHQLYMEEFHAVSAGAIAPCNRTTANLTEVSTIVEEVLTIGEPTDCREGLQPSNSITPYYQLQWDGTPGGNVSFMWQCTYGCRPADCLPALNATIGECFPMPNDSTTWVRFVDTVDACGSPPHGAQCPYSAIPTSSGQSNKASSGWSADQIGNFLLAFILALLTLLPICNPDCRLAAKDMIQQIRSWANNSKFNETAFVESAQLADVSIATRKVIAAVTLVVDLGLVISLASVQPFSSLAKWLAANLSPNQAFISTDNLSSIMDSWQDTMQILMCVTTTVQLCHVLFTFGSVQHHALRRASAFGSLFGLIAPFAMISSSPGWFFGSAVELVSNNTDMLSLKIVDFGSVALNTLLKSALLQWDNMTYLWAIVGVPTAVVIANTLVLSSLDDKMDCVPPQHRRTSVYEDELDADDVESIPLTSSASGGGGAELAVITIDQVDQFCRHVHLVSRMAHVFVAVPFVFISLQASRAVPVWGGWYLAILSVIFSVITMFLNEVVLKTARHKPSRWIAFRAAQLHAISASLIVGFYLSRWVCTGSAQGIPCSHTWSTSIWLVAASFMTSLQCFVELFTSHPPTQPAAVLTLGPLTKIVLITTTLGTAVVFVGVLLFWNPWRNIHSDVRFIFALFLLPVVILAGWAGKVWDKLPEHIREPDPGRLPYGEIWLGAGTTFLFITWANTLDTIAETTTMHRLLAFLADFGLSGNSNSPGLKKLADDWGKYVAWGPWICSTIGLSILIAAFVCEVFGERCFGRSHRAQQHRIAGFRARARGKRYSDILCIVALFPFAIGTLLPYQIDLQKDLQLLTIEESSRCAVQFDFILDSMLEGSLGLMQTTLLFGVIGILLLAIPIAIVRAHCLFLEAEYHACRDEEHGDTFVTCSSFFRHVNRTVVVDSGKQACINYARRGFCIGTVFGGFVVVSVAKVISIYTDDTVVKWSVIALCLLPIFNSIVSMLILNGDPDLGYYGATLFLGYVVPVLTLVLRLAHTYGYLTMEQLSTLAQEKDTWMTVLAEVSSVCISARIVGQWVFDHLAWRTD